ncbi:hypothetical protein C0J52_05433 [Blattella germanica]|nr:hypothetical protein C0J52_05433 [Blattella germanica]
MDHRGQFLLYKEDWCSCSPSCSQFRNISNLILRNWERLLYIFIYFIYLYCNLYKI